jgi:hypothetical protein
VFLEVVDAFDPEVGRSVELRRKRELFLDYSRLIPLASESQEVFIGLDLQQGLRVSRFSILTPH